MSSLQLPGVGLLLAIDAEYRKKAAGDKLKKIAPKKFNPEGKAWLPIMNTEREGWKFTVLFSNTQRAHELDKTNDWVVIYYDDGRGERKCTVVTEFKRSLNGKRVIRGREQECAEYFKAGCSAY
jgi:DNA polymerase (family 10)